MLTEAGAFRRVWVSLGAGCNLHRKTLIAEPAIVVYKSINKTNTKIFKTQIAKINAERNLICLKKNVIHDSNLCVKSTKTTILRASKKIERTTIQEQLMFGVINVLTYPIYFF
jgi:hypothetical protein